MEQSLGHSQTPWLQSRQTQICKILADQTKRIINEHQKLVSDSNLSLLDLYNDFYSKLYDQIQSSYIKQYEIEITNNKMNVEVALTALIDNFKQASHYVCNVLMRQKFDLEGIKQSSSKTIKNQSVCSKCYKLIAQKNIQIQKAKILNGQFYDPFNFYSEGLMDFQSQEDKMDLRKEIQILDNQKQIYAYIFSLKQRITKRAIQISQFVNQLQRYTEQNHLFEIRKTKNKRNDEKVVNFEACWRSVVEIIQQKFTQILKKIKIKRVQQFQRIRHICIQAGNGNILQNQFDKQKLQLIQKIKQNQKQSDFLRRRIESLDQELTKNKLQFEMCKFKKDEHEKEIKKILTQVQSQKEKYRRISRRLSQKQKQVQNLTYQIRSIKAQYKKQIEQMPVNEKERRNSIKKVRTLNKIRGQQRKYTHTTVLTGPNFRQSQIDVEAEDLQGKPRLGNTSNLEQEFGNKNEIKQQNQQKQRQAYIQQQIDKKTRRRVSKRATKMITKKDKDENKNVTIQRKISKQQLNRINEGKRASQIDKWQTENSQRQYDMVKTSQRNERYYKMKQSQQQQQSSFKQNNDLRKQDIKQVNLIKKMNKSYQTEPNLELHQKQLKSTHLPRSSAKYDGKFKLQRLSVPMIKSKFKNIHLQEINMTNNTIQNIKQLLSSEQKQLQNDLMGNMQISKSFYRINKPYITKSTKATQNQSTSSMNQTFQQIMVNKKMFESYMAQKSVEKLSCTLPTAINLKKRVVTQNNNQNIQIFDVSDVQNIYLSIEGSIQFQKSLKAKYSDSNIILKSNEMKFMNKILALIAGVHTYSPNTYLAVRSLLLFPYQSIVAQQNYLLIKKSEYNQIRVKQSLNKILNIHRRCRSDGKICIHLNKFIIKMQNLFNTNKQYQNINPIIQQNPYKTSTD